MSKDPAAIGIYQREGGVYWLAYQRRNKRSFVSLKTKDFAEAIVRAAEKRAAPELNQGGTIRAEVVRYLAHKLASGEFTRNTEDRATGFLKELARQFGDLAPWQVTAADAQRFYARVRERMEETSAQTYVAHARSFFRWACETAHLCSENPFDAIAMPVLVPVARAKFCTPPLRDRLIKECPRDDLRFILFCGFDAGMRRNEIVEARPAWFNLESRLVSMSKIDKRMAAATGLDPFDLKDKEERSVPISKRFAAFLRKWMDPDADYCLDPGGRRGLSRYRYDPRRFFEEYMDEKGCGWVTFHTMRKTFGSLLASNGTSIYIIAQWLGDDIETTRRHYGYLMPAHRTLEKGLHGRH